MNENLPVEESIVSESQVDFASSTIPAEIVKRLIKAQCAISPVEKDSVNRYDDYSYASSETIMKEARAALNGAGLAVMRSGWTFSMEPRACLYSEMIVVSETGETWRTTHEWPIVLNPRRASAVDKAIATALTTSQAYFLRDLLQIPRVDPSEEMDARDDTPAKERKNEMPIEQKHLNITATHAAKLMNGIASSNITVEQFCERFNIKVINDLKIGQIKEAVAYIEAHQKPKDEAQQNDSDMLSPSSAEVHRRAMREAVK